MATDKQKVDNYAYKLGDVEIDREGIPQNVVVTNKARQKITGSLIFVDPVNNKNQIEISYNGITDVSNEQSSVYDILHALINEIWGVNDGVMPNNGNDDSRIDKLSKSTSYVDSQVTTLNNAIDNKANTADVNDQINALSEDIRELNDKVDNQPDLTNYLQLTSKDTQVVDSEVIFAGELAIQAEGAKDSVYTVRITPWDIIVYDEKEKIVTGLSFPINSLGGEVAIKEDLDSVYDVLSSEIDKNTKEVIKLNAEISARIDVLDEYLDQCVVADNPANYELKRSSLTLLGADEEETTYAHGGIYWSNGKDHESLTLNFPELDGNQEFTIATEEYVQTAQKVLGDEVDKLEKAVIKCQDDINKLQIQKPELYNNTINLYVLNDTEDDQLGEIFFSVVGSKCTYKTTKEIFEKYGDGTQLYVPATGWYVKNGNTYNVCALCITETDIQLYVNATDFSIANTNYYYDIKMSTKL